MKLSTFVTAVAIMAGGINYALADTTVMSCELQNGRAVKVIWNGENLEYQYGKEGKTPEMALPNNPNDHYTMTYGHPSFANGEGVYYRFTNGKYDYVTYFSETNNETISNLGIFKDNKQIKQIKCKESFHTQLTNIYQIVDQKVNEDTPDEAQNWVVNSDDNAPPDSHAQNNSNNNEPSQQSQHPSSTTPVKVSIGNESNQVGNMDFTYRTVSITGIADGLVVNNITVNRGQCSASNTNPKRPYNLGFGATQIYKYVLYNGFANTSFNCDIVEIVVSTNQGDWTFNPVQ